ncbi:hypothetical protein C8Q80DRAFT_904402 [Daedaleopsis nitida]|nr:hypothetical protein C8Q80DRAFT_904402 [Daedaleopsis nitida]
MVTDSQDMVARPTLTSGLVALFVESLLFGAFTILYGVCAWFLVIQDVRGARARSARDLLLFILSTLMYILTMIHVALDVHIALNTFVRSGGNVMQMQETLDMYNGLANSVGAAKFGIYVTQVLIGDGFMIYRAYIVWDRKLPIVVFPILLLAAEVVLGYYISFAGPLAMPQQSAGSCVDALVNAFFVLSVVSNITSTGLIMIPILQSGGNIQDYLPYNASARSIKWRVIESILQSAAIYSITSVSLAVTSFVSPTIAFPACHSVFPSVIGIVFLLIVARICWNANAACSADLPRHSMVQVQVQAGAHAHTNANGAAYSYPNIPNTVARISRAPDPPHSPSSLRSLPIAIHVSVSTTSDRESVSSYEPGSASSIAKMLSDSDSDLDDAEIPMPMPTSPTSDHELDFGDRRRPRSLSIHELLYDEIK